MSCWTGLQCTGQDCANNLNKQCFIVDLRLRHLRFCNIKDFVRVRASSPQSLAAGRSATGLKPLASATKADSTDWVKLFFCAA